MKKRLLIAVSVVAAAAALLLLMAAAPASYTTYFYNIDVRTNLTLGGVSHSSWPAGGTAGTLINTTATAAGNLVKFTDATKTNTAPASASDIITAATGSIPVAIGAACSDETTAIAAGTAKVTFRMPYAMTVTAVRASLTTAQASGNIFTVDINEGASSILSTKITIDNTELTSTTADTAPVISDSALADDAVITVDVDQIGNGTATGLKIWLIGTR